VRSVAGGGQQGLAPVPACGRGAVDRVADAGAEGEAPARVPFRCLREAQHSLAQLTSGEDLSPPLLESTNPH
jgi:hypothetical protein